MLYNDVPWQLLLLGLGFGSAQSRWHRLGRWQQDGVFDRLRRILLTELNAASAVTGKVRRVARRAGWK
ncbi:hypothetical protein OG780_43030 [Streptomyces sp. NBC_00386]|uniref:hypothetical protein n=1 Tax=Streptomyces sp. NBC_00386 TaxID=2975734 RepID=UPI002E1AA6AB